MDGNTHEYILVVSNPSSYHRQGFTFRTAVTNFDIQVWNPYLAKFILLDNNNVNAICDSQNLDHTRENLKKCEVFI